MTPVAIIEQAAADGVRLALCRAGTIRATGITAAVNRWLPIIREHKPGIVAALHTTNDAENDALPDPAAEWRRQKVLRMLVEKPGPRYAVFTDTDADLESVIVVLAIRNRATCELRIPREKYDGVRLLDLIERHGGTVH